MENKREWHVFVTYQYCNSEVTKFRPSWKCVLGFTKQYPCLYLKLHGGCLLHLLFVKNGDYCCKGQAVLQRRGWAWSQSWAVQETGLRRLGVGGLGSCGGWHFVQELWVLYWPNKTVTRPEGSFCPPALMVAKGPGLWVRGSKSLLLPTAAMSK